ncbi:hypothetical protein ALQ81_101343 [Pseudomonas syringae pv. pisi]|uniref:Uncharacterized protein n=3 Tax=Pseudomonas syringae group TaxID=136849 RepID=A0A3M3CS36_PSESJ|nr:hypothetical protein ALQ81_101343 [Pseudomonas syringae pv. pisi]RMO23530.1 hypothetical protein ALQ44_101368 [Pseudomonas syringae pv. pisi]RMU69657.1 hypothetical protein ALP24_101809 [Pseudomonas syringae pv. aptata]RMU82779.1 hypothetical protein ALP21_101277 [Pseudomonas savastanoi pv. phaseolicola]RMV65389.1 hypothetical protein ALP08_101542 [Pseudomonas syringae pv. pisi]
MTISSFLSRIRRKPLKRGGGDFFRDGSLPIACAHLSQFQTV